MSNLSKFFEKSDLIPVIAQDAVTGEVLMLGYANEDALRRTLATKTAWFWSRSRNELWNKGETSGNYLHVLEVYGDCDNDTVLLKCRPDGPTCHTGEISCFFNKVNAE
ncbi:MAG: phosphoribosyl-AMP cyclohydrolase [Oscillospiraceae bacterium]|jgi:phosphoribosyl-AMP cyclohydrolase|nr:phosphoribosyl-AMP cyclohydrolase [Oscillospiraceae bacterium]